LIRTRRRCSGRDDIREDDELEEAEPDPHAVDPGQLDQVLDLVGVAVERAVLGARANQHGVGADHPAARSDRADVLVAAVALDVVELARRGVRDD
jgi:hypothetical protein